MSLAVDGLQNHPSLELEILYLYYMSQKGGQAIEPKYDPCWWLVLLNGPRVRDRCGCLIAKEEILREYYESIFNLNIYQKPLQTRDEFLYDAWASRTYEEDERPAWYLRYSMLVYHFYHNLYPHCPSEYYFFDEIRDIHQKRPKLAKVLE